MQCASTFTKDQQGNSRAIGALHAGAALARVITRSIERRYDCSKANFI